MFVWKEVDLEQPRLNIIMKKTRQTVEVPRKRYTGPVLEARQGGQARSLRFLQPGDRRSFPRCETGVEERGETGRAFRHHLAYHPAHVRLAAHAKRADLVNVKELLGHSTVTVSMRYAHSNDEAKRRRVGQTAYQ